MPTFDRARFIYSLAGVWRAGEWSAAALAAGLVPLMQGGVQAPKLVERALAAFAERPAYGDLAKWLQNDSHFAKAMKRAERRGVSPPRELPARLAGLDIPQLKTEKQVADWLGVEIGTLQWRADLAGRNRRNEPGPLRTYRYRWIAKKGGRARLLEIPKFDLKMMQRRILREILNKVPVHPAVHGFLRGRSAVSNAAAHCGKAVVLRFDLADFFPTVPAVRVMRIFMALGYPEIVARLLMGLCTTSLPADVWERRPGEREEGDFERRQMWITRHLPQGAPTSPALANLAAGRMDRRLAGLAAAVGAAYTRYADDLTFSGGEDLARAAARVQVKVAVVAAEEGFSLNYRKSRVLGQGVRQQVTGVVVNVRPNIRRDEYERLKAIVHNCATKGPAGQNREKMADFSAYLRGKISQVAAVHPGRGEKLRKILERVEWEK